MSIKIMSAVWESGVGPATKRLVLLALADSANDEGVCWPSVGTVSRKAGAGHSTVQRSMAELESDGILVRQFRDNQSTVYKIIVDKINKPDVAPSQIETRSRIETGGVQDRDLQGSQIETQNRKGTGTEPSPAADATETDGQTSLVPAVVVDQKTQRRSEGERGKELAAGANGLTINQVATRLAQAHYERLGGMGRVPAFMAIIRKALLREFTPDQITGALSYIAENNWTLTEERLANTLRGGPRLPGRPAPRAASTAKGEPGTEDPARMHLPPEKRGYTEHGKPTHRPDGRSIPYTRFGAEIQV